MTFSATPPCLPSTVGRPLSPVGSENECHSGESETSTTKGAAGRRPRRRQPQLDFKTSGLLVITLREMDLFIANFYLND